MLSLEEMDNLLQQDRKDEVKLLLSATSISLAYVIRDGNIMAIKQLYEMYNQFLSEFKELSTITIKNV